MAGGTGGRGSSSPPALQWNSTDYVSALGITTIDYAFATHYDADHIGCLDDLSDNGVTIGLCIDRGGAGTTQTYQDYADTCGSSRLTPTKGDVLPIGGGVNITVVDLNGAGVSTSDENALGLMLVLNFGPFDHAFGGDLPDEVEAVVADEVGDVDVYKVHHHGSNTSSSEAWLAATSPEVGIISVGNNPYGHPTAGALTMLHDHAVKTYWTNTGSGATPDGSWDKVGGTILIDVPAAQVNGYSVSGVGFADHFLY